jgi:hypothetical protein
MPDHITIKTHSTAGTAYITVPSEFVELFYDPNPCAFDHHGNCQEHSFVLDPGEICPNEELGRLLGHVR